MYRKANTGTLRPQELEAVYAISKLVAEAVEIDECLDEVVRLARPVFIFDNAALYIRGDENGGLEPKFARAIGRGRSSPAEITWGELAAQEALKQRQIFIYEADVRPEMDRLDQHFYLGLPMVIGKDVIGALVFVRFGGPPYTPDQVNLAEFVATHVSQLLSREKMVERIASLEAERRLTQLQDEFIAAVSHDLNTPLGFIKGYTTTLLREDTDWDEQARREFLTIIDDETDRLSELIGNLLDSSRLQTGSLRMDFQQLSLKGMVEEFLHRVRTRYNNLDILVHIDPAELTVWADSKRLTQVFDNVINNAAKYAPKSTLIISIHPTKENICISFEDNGPGIGPEHLDRIFERFYRVPERSAGIRGSGLGLSICQQIIRAHGGEIKVDSVVGKGTKFTIYLPILKIPGKNEYMV
jgi:signal transduction histidine kinase